MKKQVKLQQNATYWVSVPLTFTIRSRSNNALLESYTKILDLPILDLHLEYIQELVQQ